MRTHPSCQPAKCVSCGKNLCRTESTGGDLAAPLCQDCWERHCDDMWWKMCKNLVPTGNPDEYVRINPLPPIAAARNHYRRPGA